MRWLLGLNRLPKQIKELRIDKITPNSIHHIIESKFTKKGKFKKDKITAEFYTRPRFAEALAFNLSPFCYFQELRSQKFSWRFSPAGLAYILLFGLVGKLAGLPLSSIGSITSYYAQSNTVGWIKESTTWSGSRNATNSDAVYTVYTDSYLFETSYWTTPNYQIVRGRNKFDTSAIGSGATITACTNYWFISVNYRAEACKIVLCSSPTGTATSDYSGFGTTDWGSRDIGTNFATGAYRSLDMNATGMENINKTGTTYIGYRSDLDINNTAPTTNRNMLWAKTADYTGTSEDPYLSVTYTVLSNQSNFFQVL